MVLKEYGIEDKVAIVTGAGRGIGKAIALVLAEAGANVTVVARTKEQIEETAKEISKSGHTALTIPADVTNEEQVKNVVAQTVSQFGKIDILVNSAGISSGMRPAVFVQGIKFPRWELAGDEWDKPITLEWWHRVMDTNLTSIFLFAQAVGPYMLKQKKGKVINISSNSAELGSTYHSVYCVSKAGVNAFTRCLASEWAPFNICVNAIGPGATKTKMMEGKLRDPSFKKAILDGIPEGRVAEPREIALLALYLASDASNYINGETIYIDGGQLGHGAGSI